MGTEDMAMCLLHCDISDYWVNGSGGAPGRKWKCSCLSFFSCLRHRREVTDFSVMQLSLVVDSDFITDLVVD